MRIDLFSVVMAAITSSILILIIHFVTKSKQLNKHFGLSSVILLYICSIFRMVIPVDFYKVSLSIGDPFVYRFVTDHIYVPVFQEHKEHEAFGFLYVHLLACILCAVAVLFIIRLAYQYISFVKGIAKYSNLATDREKKIFAKAINRTGFKRKIKLMVIDEDITPMTYGILSPVVLLPCNDYDDKELSFVLRHELTHQKNHDIILKLLVEIYCCIFWWNPLVYLLKKDMARILELKCDVRATADCSAKEKVDYLSAILKCLKSTAANQDSPKSKLVSSVKSSLVSSEFAAAVKQDETMERFSYLLEISPKKYTGKLFTIILSAVCALILALSYIFIFMPSVLDQKEVYRKLNESILAEEGVTFVADEANSYLVKQADGSYMFYFNDPDNPDAFFVSTEEVNEGMYNCYPIYDSFRELILAQK